MLPVEYVLLFAVLLHQQASCSKIMSRKSRKEVMSDLEVEPAVNELNLRGADHIHGRS